MTEVHASEKSVDTPPFCGGASTKAGAGRYYAGWNVVGLCFLMQVFAAGPIYYAYGNYATAFATEFGASRTSINFAYSMVSFIGAIGSMPVGWLADRWPIRRLLLLGAVGTSAGLALVGQATAMWQVIVLFATLIAAADVFIGNVTSNFLVSHWFERRRGLALGLSIIGASAAAILFPPLASALIDGVGWRLTFLIFGAMTLTLLVPVWLFGRVPHEIPAFERRPVLREPIGVASFSIVELLRTRAFWIVSLCCGTMIGVNGAVMISMVPYATARGISSLDAAALVSTIGAGALAGKFVFGLVADRIDLRYAQRAGLILMIATMTLLSIDGGYPYLVAAAILFGLGLGGMMPVWGALVAHIFGLANYGRALGTTRAAMIPLAMGCPMAAGFVFDSTGSYRGAWLLFLGLLVVALLSTFAGKSWAQKLSD